MTPKFKIGDLVWLIRDNRIINQPISEVTHGCIDIDKYIYGLVEGEYILYNIRGINVSENEIFRTKKELIDHLLAPTEK